MAKSAAATVIITLSAMVFSYLRSLREPAREGVGFAFAIRFASNRSLSSSHSRARAVSINRSFRGFVAPSAGFGFANSRSPMAMER
jgi:hypothetical protein